MMNVYILLAIVTAVKGQTCGKSPLNPAARIASSYIVGGSDANPGDFPWQVGIVDGGYLICGGTYVEGTNGAVKVVTAAHCVEGRVRNYAVVFGMHDTLDSTGRQVVNANTLTVHRNYNSNTMSHDIAIIGFTSFTLTAVNTIPACLPSRTYTANENAVVSGWGTTSSGGSSSQILKYVWKPMLDYTYCNTDTGNSGDLDITMLCAGNAGKDACQGDSGGPLVAYRNGQYELVGVVSWGYGCGTANYPGVYADAFYFRSWITENI